MPRLTVESSAQGGQTGRTVLEESVNTEQLDTVRCADAFIERLGWAIVDAQEQEAEIDTATATGAGPEERKS